MKKEQAIKIITECAAMYKGHLCNRNLLIIFGDSKNPDYFETIYLPRNFLHLTGVTCSQNISSKFFYKKALSGKLSANDFELPDNGTAVMKLQVLPSLMQLCSYAKMIGHYDGSKSVLHTETPPTAQGGIPGDCSGQMSAKG